jgi:hypothetical protein
MNKNYKDNKNKNSKENINILLDTLKQKIKCIDKNTSNSNNKVKTFRISLPKKYSKKYIGLLFDDCDNNDFTDNDSDSNSTTKKSFIKLSNYSNYIINYSIHLKIESINNIIDYSFFSLGIKEINNKNIRIIKGSKQQFINKNIAINNNIIINNSIIFSSDKEQELCLIAELGSDVKIISKKSVIKLVQI